MCIAFFGNKHTFLLSKWAFQTNEMEIQTIFFQTIDMEIQTILEQSKWKFWTDWNQITYLQTFGIKSQQRKKNVN